MKTRIKKMWIEALRSGKYKKGKKALHPRDDRFCCLGVLCDLYLQEKGKTWEESGFAGDALLPLKVQRWARLDGSNPSFKKPVRKYSSMSALNDHTNIRFSSIAKEIESNL